MGRTVECRPFTVFVFDYVVSTWRAYSSIGSRRSLSFAGPPADGSGGAERFATLADVALPEALRRAGLFEAVPEEHFRVDLSSSELRAAAAAPGGGKL